MNNVLIGCLSGKTLQSFRKMLMVDLEIRGQLILVNIRDRTKKNVLLCLLSVCIFFLEHSILWNASMYCISEGFKPYLLQKVCSVDIDCCTRLA